MPQRDRSENEEDLQQRGDEERIQGIAEEEDDFDEDDEDFEDTEDEQEGTL